MKTQRRDEKKVHNSGGEIRMKTQGRDEKEEAQKDKQNEDQDTGQLKEVLPKSGEHEQPQKTEDTRWQHEQQKEAARGTQRSEQPGAAYELI